LIKLALNNTNGLVSPFFHLDRQSVRLIGFQGTKSTLQVIAKKSEFHLFRKSTCYLPRDAKLLLIKTST